VILLGFYWVNLLEFWGRSIHNVTRLRIVLLHVTLALQYPATVAKHDSARPSQIAPVEVVSNTDGHKPKEDEQDGDLQNESHIAIGHVVASGMMTL
jgi:hypothetical protein